MFKVKPLPICSSLFYVFLSVVLGVVCVVVPPYILPNGIKCDHVHFFEFIGEGIENAALYPTAIMLFVFWCLLGCAQPRIWWLLGLSAMAAFPVIAMIEIKYSPTSHNLLPIEFALYGIADIPAFVGAFIGSRFGKAKLAKRNGINTNSEDMRGT